MSSTNKTENINLSQFIGSDKPTFLGDYNSDMVKIDTAFNNLKNSTDTNTSNIATTSATASSALSNSETANEKANEAKITATSALSTATNNLEDFPMSGSISRYSILRKQGYRVLIVERHLIFYIADDNKGMVIIYAIVDGRREYRNLV